MEDIYETIYKARIPVLKRNETPTVVYLGEKEFEAVMWLARSNSAFQRLGPACRDKVFGMDIFEVDAENHLRVV